MTALPLLPHLPAARIRACYDAAPGNEIASGKFASPESSSALAANAWGFFLEAPDALPPLPGVGDIGLATSVTLEAIQRFPWSGGRHPCLDALIEMPSHIVGVESKRYEPFRAHGPPDLSDAYWRPVWGDAMAGYCGVRDWLRDEANGFAHLDAAQLVKHAFGLRTQAQRSRRRATLLYVFAEPSAWPDGTPITVQAQQRHRAEIEHFAERVAADEVGFAWVSYADLLSSWRQHAQTQAHAEAVLNAFAV